MTFYNDVIQKSPFYNTTSRVHEIGLLEPTMRSLVELIVQESPIPVMVFETYRSTQRQQFLFAQRATQLRTVGVHHYGLAADIVKSVDGQPSWDGDFSFLGVLAKKYGLLWGGNWQSRDMVHVQRITLADQPQLFAGAWYPTSDYSIA